MQTVYVCSGCNLVASKFSVGKTCRSIMLNTYKNCEGHIVSASMKIACGCNEDGPCDEHFQTGLGFVAGDVECKNLHCGGENGGEDMVIGTDGLCQWCRQAKEDEDAAGLEAYPLALEEGLQAIVLRDGADEDPSSPFRQGEFYYTAWNINICNDGGWDKAFLVICNPGCTIKRHYDPASALDYVLRIARDLRAGRGGAN